MHPSKAELFRLKMDVLLAPYQEKVYLSDGDITTEKWMSPLKIFEYMASSKPIICSDIPVLREVLTHNKNCLLCPPADISSWIKSLTDLRDDEKLRERLSENAFLDLKNNYLWEERAKRILSSI
jgi:glycosyltransferase involved in cell wall biosynthesis